MLVHAFKWHLVWSPIITAGWKPSKIAHKSISLVSGKHSSNSDICSNPSHGALAWFYTKYFVVTVKQKHVSTTMWLSDVFVRIWDNNGALQHRGMRFWLHRIYLLKLYFYGGLIVLTKNNISQPLAIKNIFHLKMISTIWWCSKVSFPSCSPRSFPFS